MPRPCTCDRVSGPTFGPGDCRLCYLYHHDDRYRVQWGGQSKRRAGCKHKGPELGLVQCPSCSGNVSVKTFACGVHGRCAPAKVLDGHGCCARCPDYEAEGVGVPTVRSLAYHVHPVSGNGVWQRNVGQLLRRISLFNGRRVVAITTGAGLDLPEEVQDLFTGHVHEFIVQPNNATLREVATFEPLLSRVLIDDPDHCFWYGHAKGVTRPVNDGVTVHPWADLLYETTLDYWPLVVRQFAEGKSVVGSFKKVGAGFDGSRSSWHYSGAFFWARSADVLRRSWKQVDRVWWGTEAWPGVHFRADEAGCLFHEGRVPTLDLYSMPYLTGVVRPAYEAWKREHHTDRTGGPNAITR